MAFWENIAPKREDPSADRIDAAPALAIKSNQERTQPQTAKFRVVSESPKPGVNVGNQLKTQANNKGTGVVGRPSSLGNKGRDFIKPATANPSGAANDTTVKYRP